MKTPGLLGGISWESTATYYRLLNEGARRRLGPREQPPILLHSINFAELHAAQLEGEWTLLARQFAARARALAEAGADVFGILANTMHIAAEAVAEAVAPKQLIHIVDVVAAEARRRGALHVGLVGTSYTMEKPFYVEALRARGLKVDLPAREDREWVNTCIYEELTLGQVLPESKARLLEMAKRLADGGADAVLLACTELGMLAHDGDGNVPLIDTTMVHAEALLEAALGRVPAP